MSAWPRGHGSVPSNSCAPEGCLILILYGQFSKQLGSVKCGRALVKMRLKSFPFIEDLQLKFHLMGEKTKQQNNPVLHLKLMQGNLHTSK